MCLVLVAYVHAIKQPAAREVTSLDSLGIPLASIEASTLTSHDVFLLELFSPYFCHCFLHILSSFWSLGIEPFWVSLSFGVATLRPNRFSNGQPPLKYQLYPF